MLKSREALLGRLANVSIGKNCTQNAQNNDGKNVILDIVDLNSRNTCNDHNVECKAGNAVHLIVIDVLAVHQSALAQILYNKLDQHCRKRCPQEVKAPSDAVGKVGKNAQKAHKAKGKRISERYKTCLQGKLVNRFVIGNFLNALLGAGRGLRLRLIVTHFEVALALVNVDVKNAEYRCYHKADRSKRETKAAIARKLCLGNVGKVNIPAECIAGALTKAKGQNQAANIRNDLLAVASNQKQNNGKSKSHKGLQHVGAALQCAKLKNLRFFGFVCALFVFERHSGKADGKAVIGDDLHHAVIDQSKAQLLADNVEYQKQSTA